jgi:hypothetical protein
MSVPAKIVFGVIPACFLLIMGLVFAGLVSTTYQKGLLATAVLGSCGLIWSLVGYSRRTAALVLVLLLFGVLGVLVGGLVGGVDGFVTAAHNNTIGSPLTVLLRALLLGWLILGPALVGLVEARRAVRVLRAVA